MWRMPRASSRRAIARAAAGEMLEKSMTSLPGAAASATPPAAKSTSSAARSSVTHIISISAAPARAAGVAAARAPLATNGASLSRLRFHTMTSCPAATRRVAMRLPMSPMPMYPKRIL
jgi:hypothetical protein